MVHEYHNLRCVQWSSLLLSAFVPCAVKQRPLQPPAAKALGQFPKRCLVIQEGSAAFELVVTAAMRQGMHVLQAAAVFCIVMTTLHLLSIMSVSAEQPRSGLDCLLLLVQHRRTCVQLATLL